MEEAQDRAPCVWHRHRDPEGDDDQRDREGEGTSAREEQTPSLEPRSDARDQIRLRREVELGGEGDECAFELSHRTPSTARAHARSATYGSLRQVERLRDLVLGQADEVAERDHAALILR